MRVILERAVALGYHTVVAGIVPPNEASVRLHEGFGFVYVGNFKEVGFKFSRWQDVAFYQLFPANQDEQELDYAVAVVRGLKFFHAF